MVSHGLLTTDEMADKNNIESIGDKSIRTLPMKNRQEIKSFLQDLYAYIGKEYFSYLRFNIDAQNEKKRRLERQKIGGYYLVQINKLNGSDVYYVRYINPETGKAYPSKWSTKQKNWELAADYAEKNKADIINKYLHKNSRLRDILQCYYEKNSPYLDEDTKKLTEYQRIKNQNYMRYFLAYFGENNIIDFNQITAANIQKFRELMYNGDNDFLPEKLRGKKSLKTINNSVSSLRRILKRMYINSVITVNPEVYLRLPKMGTNESDENKAKKRNMFPMEKLKTVFLEEWKDNYFFYLLDLTAFTTGMRNSELAKLRVKNIVELQGIKYFDLQEIGTKTQNSKRHIPLCDFVYEKIERFIAERKLENDSFIFRNQTENAGIRSQVFEEASILCGEKIGFTREMIKEKNITFYGFRHSYKTYLVSAGVPEKISEYFMGHSQKHTIADVYTNLDQAHTREIALPVIRAFNDIFNRKEK